MESITILDILRAALPAIIIYITKKTIDWFGRAITNTNRTRKNQFNKFPIEKKIEALSKIEQLTSSKDPDKKNSSYEIFQMKLLYEQIGINLPVWHCHQLVSCIVSKNIGSVDVRLNSFLKNTALGQFTDKKYVLNTKSVRNSYILNILLWIISITAFVYAWWTSVQSFMTRDTTIFFVGFSAIYLASAIVVTVYVISQIEETWLAAKFGIIFEKWLNDEIPETLKNPPIKLENNSLEIQEVFTPVTSESNKSI